MLEIDHNLSNTLKPLFLDYQWSPKEIEGQLRLEYGKAVISYQTIYRAIYRSHFDDKLSHGARGVIRKLRHRGKTHHTKGLSKTEEKFLFLIPFTKDQKTLITSSRSSSAMLSVFGTLKTSKNGFSSL